MMCLCEIWYDISDVFAFIWIKEVIITYLIQLNENLLIINDVFINRTRMRRRY